MVATHAIWCRRGEAGPGCGDGGEGRGEGGGEETLYIGMHIPQ